MRGLMPDPLVSRLLVGVLRGSVVAVQAVCTTAATQVGKATVLVEVVYLGAPILVVVAVVLDQARPLAQAVQAL